MADAWVQRWDDRYSNDGFAYGKEPNEYLKSKLAQVNSGTILLPAEGEGRNAVFAAKLGWAVSAFDISAAGKKKAMQFAEMSQVTIDYQLGELDTLDYHNGQFDAMALIYAHFPAAIKAVYHQKLGKLLRKGGIVIFEAFSKKHVDYLLADEKVGGPKDLASLFSIEEIESDFSDYDFEELMETEVQLNEGKFHSGLGSVIRFVGRKR